MKKTTMLCLLAVMLAGLFVTTDIVSAVGDMFGYGPNTESTDAIRQALETGDYETWKEAITATLTEENFNMLVERHKEMSEEREFMKEHNEDVETAIEANDYAAWKAAMESTEAVESAERPRINKENAEANESIKWQKITEIITQENFDTYVKLYEARKSGDFETAQQLSEELGLGNEPGMPCMGMHRMPFNQE